MTLHETPKEKGAIANWYSEEAESQVKFNAKIRGTSPSREERDNVRGEGFEFI